MKIVYTPRAEQQMAILLAKGIDRFGARVAAQKIRRLLSFMRLTVGRFPRTSRYQMGIDTFETWIPGTAFIVYYRLEAGINLVRVVAVFHHGKDRDDFAP
jgi:plasmid stabilization system protein ParE